MSEAKGKCKKCDISIPITDCNERSVLQGHCFPCWDANDSIPSLFDLYTEEEMGYYDVVSKWEKLNLKWQCFLCHFYYFLGDMVSRPMERWGWPVYKLYNYLMTCSSDIDEQYGQQWVWEKT